MNRQLKDSAKLARDFLSMISDGISRVESGAGEFTRSGAAELARHIPKKWRGGGGPSAGLLGTLLVAGVVAGTAVLVYKSTRPSGRRRSRR